MRTLADKSTENAQHNMTFAPIMIFAMGWLTACGGGSPSFSVLPDKNIFYQNSSATDSKTDILFVVDNSGSMASSQQNLADNFTSFIQNFTTKNLDYQIAVTTSDAYRTIFTNNTSYAKYKDGAGTTHSGIFIITPSALSVVQTFITNIMQGTSGAGDERAFQSFKTSLSHAINVPFGFPRADAFLSVIIVSDEDDFSHDGSASIAGQYANVNLHTIQSYVDYLDTLTASTATQKRYSVNAIAIWDQPCKDLLNAQTSGRRIGVRYGQLVDATSGFKASLCGDFSVELNNLAQSILELSTQFYLNEIPNQSTILVKVNDTLISQNTANGWTYNANANSIVFHGSAIPQNGSYIEVIFDPAAI